MKTFDFIEVCKNDEFIKDGYEPRKKYYKSGLFQYDICELYDGDDLYKKNYTIKIPKKGRNYLMPLILKLIEVKSIVKKIKKQK